MGRHSAKKTGKDRDMNAYKNAYFVRRNVANAARLRGTMRSA
jgi:hypothetical protein